MSIPPRMNVRIRWYGDDNDGLAKPSLELKIKRGLLCRKSVLI